jgi:CheY-like chemotaxis protein
MADGLRVLVVDDCPDTAEVQALFLRLLGHDVRLAQDGVEALIQARTFCPDVVLLDLMMPNQDGLEVARAIRRHPALRNVVLIALTGCTQERERRQARAAGFNHYLVKPAEPEVLQRLLESCRTRAPSGPEAVLNA